MNATGCYFCFTVKGSESYYQACLTINGYLIGGAAGKGRTKVEAEQNARMAYQTLLKEQASIIIG